MKRIAKILPIFLIIITMIIVLTTLTNKLFAGSYTYNAWRNGPYYDARSDTYVGSSSDINNYDNVYCLQHRAVLRSQYYYKYAYKVRLNGTKATIIEGNSNPNASEKIIRETDLFANNVMGAILCESEGRNDVLGHGGNNDWGGQRQSQFALWLYFETWCKSNGLSSYVYGQTTFPYNGAVGISWKDEYMWIATYVYHRGIVSTDADEINRRHNEGVKYIESLLPKYKAYAAEKDYNATLYIFTHGNAQNLMIVEREEPTEKGITVEKEWNDGENKYGMRREIQVKLLANGVETGETKTLNQANGWKETFTRLASDDSITYTVEEVNPPEGYKSEIISTGTGYSFKIKNTLQTQVQVVKQWDDMDDLSEIRPTSINVTLYSNGASTGKTATLNESNNWTAVFNNLDKYDTSGKEINYTIQEETINRYTQTENNKTVDDKGNITITLKNKYEPKYDGYIEIEGKVWLDKPDGKANVINGTLDSDESGIEGIKVVLKDANGNQFDATSYTTTRADGSYTIKVNYDNSQKVYKLYENVETVRTKLNTAYVEFEYDGLKYTTVATSNTGADKSRGIEDEARRSAIDGTFTRVTSGTKTLSEVSYDERKITASTKKVITSFNNYKAIAGNAGSRTEKATIKYCNGNGTYVKTDPIESWKMVTGNHTCPNCQGRGHILKTFDVTIEKIQNVNLGLFLREQPDISINSTISQAEVTMNGQKYTYKYNAVVPSENDADVKAQFQNKQSYTYRTPVNPANIAYVKEESRDAMSMYITYVVKVTNESSNLRATIYNIINCFDSRYELVSITKDGKEITGTASNSTIYNKDDTSETDFNEVLIKGLDIKLEPEETSSAIYLKYKVSTDAIIGLLNEDATLSNVVEIESYSTEYSDTTLYAEQRSGGRTGQQYGGYDKDSHPGNAGIKVQEVNYTYTYTDSNGVKQTRVYEKVRVLKSTENLIKYTLPDGTVVDMPEDDTDIAPSLLLSKENEERILSGNVWEDTDADNGSGADNFRLGDGKRGDNEKGVANVKVELHKVNADGSVADTPTTLYKVNADGTTQTKQAIAYSNGDGYYSFGEKDGYSVVTDTYIIKFVYGAGIATESGTITSAIDGSNINARDYKSTIIAEGTELYKVYKGTSNSEEWHLNLEKGRSIAVDQIEQRVAIKDLQYSNFETPISIEAYSKPFKAQVENDPSAEKASEVEASGETKFGKELNVFDFGIIERAREDIFVDKTISHIKITLANGQELVNGNPYADKLSYVKTMGFGQKITNGSLARNALDKQMLIEMDAELVQGATMEVEYVLTVRNNSEKDYDYYLGDTAETYDATKLRTEYYYFGTNNEGSTEVTSSVNEVVDYVDSELIYEFDDSTLWQKKTADDLRTEGEEKVNELTSKELKDNKYVAYVTEQFNNLKPGETKTVTAKATRVLANKDENVYENHLEILKIDAKTARTTKATGEDKEYKMGNYVPSTETRKVSTSSNLEQAGLHEQDDDRVRIIITPPTGATNNIMIYIVIALVTLVAVAGTIILIKRKAFNK